jgi:predicted amidohydrolase YtcJ
VAPLDQMFMIWSAVNRVSRGGEVIGPDHRAGPLEAVAGHDDRCRPPVPRADVQGSIEAGKLVVVVILDRNSLKVELLRIKDIKVLEAMKEGRTIYSKVRQGQ